MQSQKVTIYSTPTCPYCKQAKAFFDEHHVQYEDKNVATLLTYLGFGALIPAWRWLAFGLIAIGAAGFMLDYRSHKNPYPLALLFLGAILLYVGRYVFQST